jgi:transcriptional regulator with XRE-family HTH domain
MAVRDRAAYRGSRSWTKLRYEIGTELRDARRAAGLTQRDIALAVATSQMEISCIERGASPHVPAETLCRIAPVVGMRLSMKLYPEGPPVRDAAQLAGLATLRARCHPSFHWRHEVPVTNDPDDRRAWDAELSRPGVLIHVEYEANLVDMQSLERRLMLKKRDGEPATMIVVIRSTKRNRTVPRQVGGSLLDSFPLRTRATLAALARGEAPADCTIIL